MGAALGRVPGGGVVGVFFVELPENGSKAGDRLLRHYHVTYPLSILFLVYLTLPFVLRHDPASRLRGLGIAIMICLGLKILDATVWDLGSRGFLQPVLAAWIPVIVSGSLVTVLFDSLDK